MLAAGGMDGRRLKWSRAGWICVCASLLAACGQSSPTSTLVPETTRVTHGVSPTPLPPLPATATLTPEPLAAVVNGEAITLAAYDQEVKRCQAGLRQSQAGLDPADCPAAALQSLIEQKAVEQAAVAAGIAVSDEDLEAALTKITGGLGGAEAYPAWLTANLYTDDEFRQALRRDLLRARMAEKVAEKIGDRAEQVHARELLVADETTAQNLLEQVKSGTDFAALALAYSLDLSSRPAGGDLGWFPRGLLTTPEVEQAAFALQPGETSAVIHSALGYHLVQTLERDPAHPLSPGAEQRLRDRAHQDWLERLLAEAVIQKFVDP